MLIEPGGTRGSRACACARARAAAGSRRRCWPPRRGEARAAGAVRIGMHAQTGALALYERAGYTPYGERFDEEGIEHIGMEKHLT
jgi:hypothetical protein